MVRHGLSVFCLLLLVFASTVLGAEEPGIEEIPGMKAQAVTLDIDIRVVEPNRLVTWKEAHERVTIPGRSVGIRLVGSNVVVVVQFTPYIRAKGQHTLTAQGQIWVEVPGQGIRYQTSMQTIPLDYDEPILFFPLGSTVTEDSARIEIKIIMKQYKDPAVPSPGTPANMPGRNR